MTCNAPCLLGVATLKLHKAGASILLDCDLDFILLWRASREYSKLGQAEVRAHIAWAHFVNDVVRVAWEHNKLLVTSIEKYVHVRFRSQTEELRYQE